jgi:hypothetical protein
MQNNLKATELRIGNFVKFQGEIIEIDGIDKFNIHWGNGNFAPITINGFFQPIPLTEEWLEKFGFEKDGYNCEKTFYFEKNGIIINNYDGYFLDNPNELVGKRLFIKHCHQLQNLYFCLCGEELTIKE